MNIVSIIQREIDKRLPKSLQAKVIAVDEAKAVCDVAPLDGGADILGIRLNAGTGNSLGITPVPKTGSIVTVTMLNKTAGYVALCSEIEKYILICDKVQFNNGSLGGLIKIEDLISKLNTVEGDLNSLKKVFSTTWVVVPSDGGAALKTAAANWAGDTITKTIVTDLENSKVKHG